ncbi:hypothetical protein GH714_010201 [Hevea brasiliensis]|uniref:RNase H type-1 domain-containing protein n=1 Tax=Hevea brasiliensis TaxID=3981 RepID=A0A6A6KEX3_HEVBR|nr:hypothetical protein GH714_010201 [Hevea brasiliensis]
MRVDASVCWYPPPDGWFKLNSNGSRRVGGFTATGVFCEIVKGGGIRVIQIIAICNDDWAVRVHHVDREADWIAGYATALQLGVLVFDQPLMSVSS